MELFWAAVSCDEKKWLKTFSLFHLFFFGMQFSIFHLFIFLTIHPNQKKIISIADNWEKKAQRKVGGVRGKLRALFEFQIHFNFSPSTSSVRFWEKWKKNFLICINAFVSLTKKLLLIFIFLHRTINFNLRFFYSANIVHYHYFHNLSLSEHLLIIFLYFIYFLS